ncbi:hypothetical protein ACFSRY_05165 [Pontibacter locisalis]|uniref:EF-hand domain-containing protein n=1 Tax=Pontibacter locisalis TaxID=1719035 RepID=A0ABW5IJF4_9BACT
MKRMNRINRTIKWGLCLTLLGGLIACNPGKEAVEDGVILDDIEKEEVEVTTTGTWDKNLFNTTFASTNYYEDWDVNDDNMLDQNEYMGGFYDTWDTNNDNRLDENEWKTATSDFGMENEDWITWDGNADGVLDEVEFGTNFAKNGWFNSWDTDRNSMLTEREYTDGLFGLWDENRDGMLDENEYGAYNTYFGV